MVAPGVVLQPRTGRAFLRGVNAIVDAVAPTLGPSGKLVAIASENGGQPPELLDSAAVIARRLIELPDRDENIGAMYVRHLLWRLHERQGDGAATTAVIFRAILTESARYLAAGGNAARLRTSLNAQLSALRTHFEALALPAEEIALSTLVEGLGGDANLSVLLGEAFEQVGLDGAIEVRANNTAEDWLEFIDGAYWKSEPLAEQKLAAGQREMRRAHVLITDLTLDTLPDALHVVKAAVGAGVSALLLFAGSLSEEVRAFFATVGKPGKFEVIAARLPGLQAADQMAAIDDLAVLTGALPLLRAAGDSPASLRQAHFGTAGRVWMMRQYVGIDDVGGSVERIAAQRDRLRLMAESAGIPEALTSRIGRLSGRSAVLVVGGVSADDIQRRVALANRTIRAVRSAVHTGVVAGGGAAYWQLAQRLRQQLHRDEEDQTAARILATALEAPLRTIAVNTGHDPGLACGLLAQTCPQQSVDARHHRVVDCLETGLVVPSALAWDCLHSAVSSAAQAITIDVFVKHRNPEIMSDP